MNESIEVPNFLLQWANILERYRTVIFLPIFLLLVIVAFAEYQEVKEYREFLETHDTIDACARLFKYKDPFTGGLITDVRDPNFMIYRNLESKAWINQTE